MNAQHGKDGRSRPRFPADVALLLGFPFITVAMALGTGIPLMWAWNHPSDAVLLGALLGVAGICLLAIARLPLYRQRRFFSFGVRGLDRMHRRLYWCAYAVITCGVFMLLLVIATSR